jgi:hypothetical protein
LAPAHKLPLILSELTAAEAVAGIKAGAAKAAKAASESIRVLILFSIYLSLVTCY